MTAPRSSGGSRDRARRARPPQAARPAAAQGVRGFLIALAAAGLLVYGNSSSGAFVRDDQVAIIENTSIRALTDLPALLFPERELPVAGRPLVNVSFALNYAAGGSSVRGYHLVNLTLHIVCGFLVFGAVRRTVELLRRPSSVRPPAFVPDAGWFGFATALVWLVHPLNTDAVDYLTQRTELLMASFYLLTLYASIRALDSGTRRRWTVLAVAACAAGMTCKESMATAPVIVVLFDGLVAFSSFPQAVKARWRLYAALAATWVILAALVWSGPRVHSAGFSTGVTPWTYLLNQTVMIVRYLRLALWPHGLVTEYGWPRPLGLADVWPEALAVAGLATVTLVSAVVWPVLGFLGSWFFVTLAPTSSLVPIATEVGAERRMYLPLIACVVLAEFGVWRMIRTLPAKVAVIARPAFAAGGLLLVASVALGAGTWLRNRDYQSAVALAQTAVDRYPTGVARLELATALLEEGRHEDAMPHLRLAVRDNPRAHHTLGIELLNQGSLDEAITELQAFVRDQPELVEVVTARLGLGQAFARQGRWPEAAEQYRLVLNLHPSPAELADAEGHLAEALYRTQTFDEAIIWYGRYLQARPADAVALTQLGLSYVATGRIEDALSVFRHAVEIAPEDVAARHNLATALYDHRDLDEALIHARKLVALRPDSAAGHQLLGRILALRGATAEGAAELERALRLEPGNVEIREDLRRVPQIRPATPARP